MHNRRSAGISILIVAMMAALLTGLPCRAAADDNPPQKDITAVLANTMNTGGVAANAKLVNAGEKFGKEINVLGKDASRMMGVSTQSKPFLGMSWIELLIRLTLVALIVLLERVIRLVLSRYDRIMAARRKDNASVTFVDALSRPMSLFIIFFGSYGALYPLIKYSKLFHEIASRAADVVATYCLVWFCYRIIGVIEARLSSRAERTKSDLDDTLVPLLGRIMRILIVIGGLIMIIHGLTGLDVGPMMASLGIGGIAVALAAKDSLANFIGSMTILFDRPFTMGDRIVIDGHDGVVEEVGFRCTRIRTLAGHQVSIPNEKVVNTTLVNIGRSNFQRWQCILELSSVNEPDRIQRAVELIEATLAGHEGMRPEQPPKVFITALKEKSVTITATAWYYPADGKAFQEWSQRINLQILRDLKDAGATLAAA